MDRMHLPSIFLILMAGMSPTSALPLSGNLVAAQDNSSSIRLCVDVQIAPGMWPPGNADEADQDLTSLLRGELISLVKQGGGNPYSSKGNPTIVRTNDHAACDSRDLTTATLRYAYLPNGRPYAAYVSVTGPHVNIDKYYTNDISEKLTYAKINKTQVSIVEDLRERAKAIYKIFNSALMEQ